MLEGKQLSAAPVMAWPAPMKQGSEAPLQDLEKGLQGVCSEDNLEASPDEEE